MEESESEEGICCRRRKIGSGTGSGDFLYGLSYEGDRELEL